MVETGTIRADFNAMVANYPKHNNLPPHIKGYIDGLNKNIPDGKPKNTPCCLQMSQALNATGQVIYSHSFRRANQKLGDNYYIQAVDELEHYLVGRYGRTEDIKTDQWKNSRTKDKMKEYLDGKQGLLVFRDTGAGAHTELWDKNSIIQKAGAPGGMSEDYIFKQPRILFWQVTDKADANPVPLWLRGWWDVNDNAQYYYYFSDQHGVTYTKVKPAALGVAPPKQPLNEGTVTISATPPHIVIDWNPADGGETKEEFTREPPSSESAMRGKSNRYGGLLAKKMT